MLSLTWKPLKIILIEGALRCKIYLKAALYLVLCICFKNICYLHTYIIEPKETQVRRAGETTKRGGRRQEGGTPAGLAPGTNLTSVSEKTTMERQTHGEADI